MVRVRLTAHGGVASVRQLTDLGVSRHVVHRLIASGALISLRRDVVVDPAVWEQAPGSARHELRPAASCTACPVLG